MTKQNQTSAPSAHVGLRVSGPLLATIDAETERLRKESPHFNPTRSDAVRSLLARGASVVVVGGPVARGTLRVRKGVVLPEAEGLVELGEGGPIAVEGGV